MKQQPVDKAMEFDPIWQHRHFCPWISADGSAAPGWQQTLSALQHQKDFGDLSPSDSRSLSIIKVLQNFSTIITYPSGGTTWMKESQEV